MRVCRMILSNFSAHIFFRMVLLSTRLFPIHFGYKHIANEFTRVPQSFLFWFAFLLTILLFRMKYVDGCVCVCVWKIFSNTFFVFFDFESTQKSNENEMKMREMMTVIENRLTQFL